MITAGDEVLRVQDLRVEFNTARGLVRAVNGLNLSLRRGETLGLVGESGSGKTVASLAMLRLIVPPVGRMASGRIVIAGEDITALPLREMPRIRGRRISMILQDPTSSLNPGMRIGDQVGEAIALHQDLRGSQLRQRVVDILRQVGIAEPERRMRDYPHQLSGGMRQRVVGAIALSCQPDVLIADEPTTSLDPTIRIQFLRLLKAMQSEIGFGMVFVSHDLSAVAKISDRIAVMYAGEIVEIGPTHDILSRPQHPYTNALVAIMRSASHAGATRLARIDGQPPDLVALPPGCTFAPRCRAALAICAERRPPECAIAVAHRARCWLPAGAAS